MLIQVSKEGDYSYCKLYNCCCILTLPNLTFRTRHTVLLVWGNYTKTEIAHCLLLVWSVY